MTIENNPDIKEDKVHIPRPEYPEALIEHFSTAVSYTHLTLPTN